MLVERRNNRCSPRAFIHPKLRCYVTMYDVKGGDWRMVKFDGIVRYGGIR